MSHILERFPNLLNFTDTELRLVEQHKVLVQIIVIEQNVTLCKQARIPSGTPCFLNIVFKRIGNIIVNNQLDVFFINAHTESRGGNNDFHLIVYKRFLICDFLIRVHFPVERFCRKAIARQFFCELNRASCAGNIYNRRAILLCNQ